MAKQNITVSIYNSDSEDSSPPEQLLKFKQWLDTQIEKVPLNKISERDTTIEFDTEYDSSDITIKISYSRQETDEEEKEREDKVKKRAIDTENRERQLLAQLKSKYEKENK